MKEMGSNETKMEGKMENPYPDLGENTLLLEGPSDQGLEVHHLPRVFVHLFFSGSRVSVRGSGIVSESSHSLSFSTFEIFAA